MKLWLVLVCTFGIFVQFAESKEVQGVSCSTRQSVLGDSLISKTDMTLKGHVRKTLEKITFIQCSLRCLKEDWCISVNFEIQKKMGKCELNDYGVEDETSVSIEKGEFEKKEGFVYTQLRPAGSGCHDNTCHNGGSCVIDCIQWQSQCYCLSGFRGDRCEEPNTGCSSNPCLYGGTCTDQVNGYSCTCAVGYNGTRCENNIDECSSNPCRNGGTCTDQVNGYSCTCAAGYNGTRCENNCDLHFPTARTSNSIIIDAAFQTQLSEFTVSFWLKVSNEEVIFYPLSYATQSTPAAFVIGIKDDGIAEITVRGETKALDSGVKRDNTWQHCAITWKSSSGRVRFYHQGSKTASKNGLKRRETIPHGGKMVIGQYQGSYGGGYDSSKLMLGYLADLNIWSSELTSSAINSLSSKCFMSTSSAPVLSWSTIISKPLGGQLSKTCPATCLS